MLIVGNSLKSVNDKSAPISNFSGWAVKRQFERELEQKYNSRFSLDTKDYKLITNEHFRILQRIAFNNGTAALALINNEWYPYIVSVLSRDGLMRPKTGILLNPAQLQADGNYAPLLKDENIKGKVIDLQGNDILILEYMDFEPVLYNKFQGISGIEHVEPFTKQIVNISRELHLMVKASRGTILVNGNTQLSTQINDNIRNKAEDDMVVAIGNAGDVKVNELDINSVDNKLKIGDIKKLDNNFEVNKYMELLIQQKDFAFQALGIRKEIRYKAERMITGEVNAQNEIFRLSEKQQEQQLNKFLKQVKDKLGLEFSLINNVDDIPDQNTVQGENLVAIQKSEGNLI